MVLRVAGLAKGKTGFWNVGVEEDLCNDAQVP